MKPTMLILAAALASFAAVSFAKNTNVKGHYGNTWRLCESCMVG